MDATRDGSEAGRDWLGPAGSKDRADGTRASIPGSDGPSAPSIWARSTAVKVLCAGDRPPFAPAVYGRTETGIRDSDWIWTSARHRGRSMNKLRSVQIWNAQPDLSPAVQGSVYAAAVVCTHADESQNAMLPVVHGGLAGDCGRWDDEVLLKGRRSIESCAHVA